MLIMQKKETAMEIRYFTQYLNAWFSIAGDDEDPVAEYCGHTKPSVDPGKIRQFSNLPGNEKGAVEKCHAKHTTSEMLG